MSIIEVRASHFDGRGSKKDFLVHLVILLIHGSEFLIKGGEKGTEEPSRIGFCPCALSGVSARGSGPKIIVS